MKWVWENRWWAEAASAVSSRLACGGDGAEGSQRRGEAETSPQEASSHAIKTLPVTAEEYLKGRELTGKGG